MNLDTLKKQLIRDEALRLKPYKDKFGKLTIGVGRNLDDKGISDREAAFLLENDIAEHVALLDKYLPWYTKLDESRQLALVNMAFNLGVGPSPEQPLGKLLTFSRTLALLAVGNYEKAASNLTMSDWYKQVGQRAVRIVAIIKGA